MCIFAVACSRESPVREQEAPVPVAVAQAAKNDGAEVHNHVYVQAWGTGWPGRVYLPNVELWVRDVATGVDSVHVRSDGHGFFGVPRQPAGTYRLCWSAAGFVSGCQTTTFVLGDDTYVMPEHLPLVALRPLLWGRVLLRGGAVPYRLHSALGIAVGATVRVSNPSTGGSVASAAPVNAQGYYAVGDVPAGTWSVVAQVENEQAVTALVMGTSVIQRDVTLRNAPPVVRAPVAWRGSQALRRALPGETLSLTAEASDSDGDPLAWRWVASAGSGVVQGEGTQVRWTLPKSNGRFSVWAVVTDKRGGVATSELRLSTQGPIAYFGGTVVNAEGKPVEGARVTVNGEGADTNARGGFLMGVTEADRYVLNIRATGYQLLSRVVLDEAPERTYRLVAAQAFTIDPLAENTLSARVGTGEQRPVRLTIQANSLVDEAGQPATQPLTAWLAPVDLSDPEGRMPGDLAAFDREGRVVTLTSFGAMEVNIRDAEGRRYNLRQGLPAKAIFPLDPKQAQAGAPQSMPLWFYQEEAGVWVEEGTFVLAGDEYVAPIPHFSVFNADIVSTGADCMRVHIDTARLPVPLTVRITIPGVGTPTVYTTTFDAALNAVTRLPANTLIKYEVLDSNGLVISTATVNELSGAGNASTNDLSVPYPYSVCTSDVTLTLGVPLPATPNFLNYYGNGSAADAATYYAAIDPGSTKLTLAAWKTANGFGADDAAAFYFNNGDLGFGRSMHMKRSGANRAFYVTNHASVDLSIFNIAPIATVAMEYSPHPTLGGTQYTKFYVFDGAGNRVDRADLDGGGDKFIPHLCNVCHGGDPFTADPRGDTNARFIPFDLESYRYSTMESPPGSGIFPWSRASQEAQFKELNKAVLETNFTTTVQELVQGWYGGASLPNTTQNSTFVQPNWAAAGKSNAYLQVQAPSCRACHSTREGQLSWRYWSLAGGGNDFQERSSIYFAVCSPFRRMPHAKRTYQNFWLSTSPHQPNVLANAGIAGWTPADPCPQ
ncbi:carboxypeptidase-like regulatory domain-containing protein [Myxococcus dinghuensis]|uniref:carboxypeptidase-like regulatory domain-containing protein n=1 Tax=Myxococcus dinghuensis TaxID=2906761 RepID=UPI002B203E09|nr:carboxypeptidase regulatory-like domain-containing protein [Myxococcus dinghuensis]